MNLDDQTGDGLVVRAEPAILDRFYANYSTRNPLHMVDDVDAYLRRWRPTVMTGEQLTDRETYLKSEHYNVLHRLIKADWSAMVRLSVQDRRLTSIQIGRRESHGGFVKRELDSLRRIQPHFIRALHLTDKLALDRSVGRAGWQGLEGLAVAAFLLTPDCRLLRLNEAAETLCRAETGGCQQRAGGSAPPTQPSRARWPRW